MDAVAELSRRVPTTARRVGADGVETVPLDEIVIGDRVRVAADEDVPVDGNVVVGGGTLDESTITGEATPVERVEGDRVFAGTRVTSGLLTIEASSAGSDTTVVRIIRAVEDAQAGKTNLQRLADRVAGVFVPTVVIVAALTLLGWVVASGTSGLAPGLQAAIAVLVVACPCALGLATPTAVAVATGEAARRGILVRDPVALETAGRVDTVILDKTGTLTTGTFMVTGLRAVRESGIDETELLQLAAAAEANASHGIGRAIVEEARRRDLRVPEAVSFESRVGMGVEAAVAGRRILVGSRRFMERSDINASAAQDAVDAVCRAGGAPVLVAVDGRLVGVIGVADTVRPGAAEAVRRLRAAGLSVAMVTGDGRNVAEAVASDVGIDEVSAEVTPLGKVEAVQRLRDAGRRVAFVGDGTNDAPALATADVGIAFAAGTDAANAAAGVSLVSDAIRQVPAVLEISRLSRRTIKQNLFWAFVYNVVAIPLAAMNVLAPAYAAAAMMLSSISVVLNALRLGRLVRRRLAQT
jgi:Cu+-exporting ATPase